MKATTRRGAAGALPAKKKTKKKARGFMCGCGGSKSVSTVSRAAVANISPAATTTPVKAATVSAPKPTITAAAKTTTIMPGFSVSGEDQGEEDGSAEGTPSVDALLQELRELEQGVRALGVRDRWEGDAPRPRPRHRRSATTEWGGVVAGCGRRLEAEGVAVVTETEDPLGDFRRSMAQMVVENGITGGAELRALLQRFLSLNAPHHHHLILRAFADVWEEFFAGGGRAPPPPPAAEVSNHYYRATSSKRPYGRADTLTARSTTPTPVV